MRSAEFTSILVRQREILRDMPMPSAKRISPIAEVVNVTSILSLLRDSQASFAFFLNAAQSGFCLHLFAMNRYQTFQS